MVVYISASISNERYETVLSTHTHTHTYTIETCSYRPTLRSSSLPSCHAKVVFFLVLGDRYKQLGRCKSDAQTLALPTLLISLSKQRSVVWYLTPLLASTAAC